MIVDDTDIRQRAWRFWAKVDKDGPIQDHMTTPCWLWAASRTDRGYGRFTKAGPQKIILAHRVAYFLTHGQWPLPMCLHHCDNPPCVNPSHLYAGTSQDNVHDCQQRGRANTPRGSQQGHSKISESDVLHIRQLFAEGKDVNTIQQIYNLFPSHLHQIKRRVTWAWLD